MTAEDIPGRAGPWTVGEPVMGDTAPRRIDGGVDQRRMRLQIDQEGFEFVPSDCELKFQTLLQSAKMNCCLAILFVT